MKSSDHQEFIRIKITTYEKGQTKSNKMDRQHNGMNNQNTKFLCSICLNTKAKTKDEKHLECNKRKSKSCPMCQKTCELNVHNSNERIKIETNDNKKLDDISTKNIQTSNTDVAQGLNLLNEVLTVFQSKKQLDIKKERSAKTIIVKDASVSTDIGTNALKPKLTVSKIFQFSIDEDNVNENGKFCIVNSCQPEAYHSQYSIDLIKHKSSSIPQMKMDELKNSFKEKTKSKDAIEEVNRMFATVRKIDRSDNCNRPQVRNGPRVLPVVKTNTFGISTQNKSEENISVHSDSKQSCKCCETNYYLSSGDSLAKQECCHRKCGNDRCEKSVYMMCCQYKNHKRDVQTDVLICERCKKLQNRHFEDECTGYL